MKKSARSGNRFTVVLVTTPDRKSGRRLAQAALKARLAACANLVPGVESHYWWQGKLEKSGEVLVLFKTLTRHLAALEKVVLTVHPYDTPEFIALPVTEGNQRYLDWISREATAQPA